MRLRDLAICFLCVVLAGGVFFGASQRLEKIHTAREDLGLVSNAALENAPPSLAFATVAMGAFRGLVVDVLWMRADKMKEEGKFFDARQLAEWITVLQPRFAKVWDFQAWNMAYNISVAVPAAQWQQRWRWVQNGYELLRDKGIEMNPKSILLYRSLAWIFQHKIAGVNDDCHNHYKRELAQTMGKLVDPATNDNFRSLAAAPETLSEIIADPGVAEFISALKSADKAFGEDDRFVTNYLALRQRPDIFDAEAHEVINHFRGSETLEKFDVFAKAHQLRNIWKFDIDLMVSLNEKYGPLRSDSADDRLPLNWGHPDVHAIYWAEKGLEVAGRQGEYSIEEKNTDRIVFHSLQSLYRRGKTFIYPVKDKPSLVFLRPDLQMFGSCDQYWQDTIAKYDVFEDGKARGLTNGHRNFLINAVSTFYQAGQTAKAGKIYNNLRTAYPREEFKVPLLTFVKRRLKEELSAISIKDATEMIIMSLREAYFRYAVHDDDQAFGREKFAKEVYAVYQAEFGGLEYGEAEVERSAMPAFDVLKYRAFVDFLNDPFYPEEMRNRLVGRMEVERPDILEKLQLQHEIFIKKAQEAGSTAP